jgi:ABC-type sulfate transport system substrate-binding protein
LTWENEAIHEAGESDGKSQVVYPPLSILAEPYVAWVDANVARRGTLAMVAVTRDAGSGSLTHYQLC